jgi:D-arabinose 1-dehydrogenase-like Zn-dependent alcohol dehydrogenase
MLEVPERMRAAYITELGPADAIRVGELPVPAIGPTDVLVRVEVVAVDPVDTMVRSGAYPTPTPFPFVVGRDLVGTVVVASPGAPGFAPGDRVWCNSLGHDGRQGSFAEYAPVPAERLYHLPAAVDPVAAVAVLHPAATAYLALFHHGALRPGETVYVGGAAGNVGTALTSLARLGGARVLAGARSEDAGWCRSAAAAEVVDYRDPDLDGLAAPRPARAALRCRHGHRPGGRVRAGLAAGAARHDAGRRDHELPAVGLAGGDPDRVGRGRRGRGNGPPAGPCAGRSALRTLGCAGHRAPEGPSTWSATW